MKKVLAELHQLINSLEDHGLTAEASSLQEVFVRVAQKADPNDLSEKVTDLLGKYSAPELIAALAEQMDSKDTKTMSFAFGEEPRDVIVNEFVDQAKNKDMRQDDAYFMMNQRLQFNGHPTLTKQEFDAKVNSSGTNISEFAFGDEPDGTEPVQRGRVPNKPTFWRTPEPESQQTAPVVSRESVISSYVLTAFNDKYGPNGRNAYTNLSEELAKLGYPPLSKEDFDNLVRKGLIPKKDGSYKQLQGQVVAPPVTPEILEQMKKDWAAMTKRHEELGYTSSFPLSSR